MEAGLEQKVAIVSHGPVSLGEALSILRGSLLLKGIEVREVGTAEVFVSRVADPMVPNLRTTTYLPRLSQERAEQIADAEFERVPERVGHESDYSCMVRYLVEKRSWTVSYSRKNGRDDFAVVIDDCTEKVSVFMP
ncbi:MAG: hypothetical protein ABI946_06680 [Chthoniobacterales bacterium]